MDGGGVLNRSEFEHDDVEMIRWAGVLQETSLGDVDADEQQYF